jgi:coenzyme F420-reducing hydrogenase delta subunit
MKDIGLEPERMKMIQLSSAMGSRFAEEAQRMTDEVRALGPSPLRPGRPAQPDDISIESEAGA